MTDTAFKPRVSLDAEQAVLGACFHGGLQQVKDVLTPGDFYSPERGAAFAALVELHDGGVRPDIPMVVDIMRQHGAATDGTSRMLLDCEMNPSSNGSALARYAVIVQRDSLSRELAAIFAEGRQAMQDPTVDPGEFLEAHRSRLQEVNSALSANGLGALSVEDFLDKPPESRAPWAIPGLLRTDWRMVLVADEGVGKSYLLTQLAVMASWGIHPFIPNDPIPPIRVMIVDLENPEQEVHERIVRVSKSCRALNPWRLDSKPQSWLIRKPGGIDLRKRSHRLAFESDLRTNRPEMVVMGPVYKSYQRTAKENDEQVAGEVQSVLDDLRSRYGFGLILEHHAPKAERGSKRDLVPFGSSLWLRWTELGFSLSRTDAKFPAMVLKIGKYRGDRVAHNWPDEIHRGKNWPWEGYWDQGYASDGSPLQEPPEDLL